MADPANARRNDITAGALFIVVAALFLVLGRDLELGTLRTMGAGFFPMIVSALIAVLGVAMIAGGLRKPAPPRPAATGQTPAVPAAAAGTAGSAAAAGATRALPSAWRPLACVLGSVLLFAVLVEPFGLAPSLSLAVLLATLGGSPWKPIRSIVISILITLFCWLVFVVALGMPMPLFALPGA